MSLILPKSPNFDWAGDGQRIVCPCCGCAHPHTEKFRHHMELLQELRTWWGASLLVTSGYRCPAYNKKVGGAAKSQHILRRVFGDDTFATDIVAGLPSPRYDVLSRRTQKQHYEHWFQAHMTLAEKAKELGFNGIGVYRGDPMKSEEPSIHLDLREGKFKSWGSDEAKSLGT